MLHSSRANQVELVVKMSVVSSGRVVLQPLHVDQSDDAEVICRRNQDADLRHVSMVAICTLAGRRGGHILPTTCEYQKHGEQKHNPAVAAH